MMFDPHIEWMTYNDETPRCILKRSVKQKITTKHTYAYAGAHTKSLMYPHTHTRVST
jgi:hypothetical protein